MNQHLTAQDIAKELNISKRQSERIFAKLKEKNLILRIGSAKGGYWKILN